MVNLRRTIGVAAMVALAITQCVIFALTEQSTQDTSALSNAAYETVTSLSSSTSTPAAAGASGASGFAGSSGASGSAGTGGSADSGSSGAGGVSGASGSSAAATSGANGISAASSAQPPFYQSAINWALGIADIRKWAHVLEFLPTGLFAAIAFLALGQAKTKRRRLFVAAVAACLALSLFDQTHKLFVIGRHFDVTDLAFDAMGYAFAILVTFALAQLAKVLPRR